MTDATFAHKSDASIPSFGGGQSHRNSVRERRMELRASSPERIIARLESVAELAAGLTASAVVSEAASVMPPPSSEGIRCRFQFSP